MKDILGNSLNKLQTMLKLEIACNTLKGIDEVLSGPNRSRVEKALAMINEVVAELSKEIKSDRGVKL
jgi:hypothetical protein